YLHRSGRTGRAGKTGIVVSLVADEQGSANRVLQRALGFDPVVHPRGSQGSVDPRPRPTKVDTRVKSRIDQSEPRGGGDRPRTPNVKQRTQGPAPRLPFRAPRPRKSGQRAAGRSPTRAPVGTVRFFDAKKGYGFLSRPDGAGDVFVHVSSIQGLGVPVLVPGQQVRFEMTTGRKGDEACNVMVI
ncbi:MAG: cold shock domain-containing protein, partial [Fimbriimonadales bacterium]